MSEDNFDLEQEQKQLVLERLKTLNPDSKISLGGGEEFSVKDLIKHVEEGDEFGKRIIQAQILMIKVLSGAD